MNSDGCFFNTSVDGVFHPPYVPRIDEIERGIQQPSNVDSIEQPTVQPQNDRRSLHDRRGIPDAYGENLRDEIQEKIPKT